MNPRVLPLLFVLLPQFARAAGPWPEHVPVREVQTRLKALGYYRGDVDGVPGSQTAAAIRRYQLAQGLKVTGEMNPQTAESLGYAAGVSSGQEDIFAKGILATVPESRRREIIRKVQEYLKKRGYAVGDVDGVAGPQTLAALRAWQKQAGFPFPGRLDAATLERMGIRP